MSSFDEYRKKLQSKYGLTVNIKDEEEKTSQKGSSATSTTAQATPVSSSGQSTFDSYRQKLRSKYLPDNVDSAGIYKWLDDAYSAMEEMENYNKANASKYDANYGGEAGERIKSLLNSSKDVYDYIYNHADEFENADELKKILSEYRSTLISFDRGNYDTRKYYSQFGSEEGYNNHLKAVEYGGKSLEELEAEHNKYKAAYESDLAYDIKEAEIQLADLKANATSPTDYASQEAYFNELKAKFEKEYGIEWSFTEQHNPTLYYDEHGAVTLQNLLTIKKTDSKIAAVKSDAALSSSYEELVTYTEDIRQMESAMAALDAKTEGATPTDGQKTALAYIVDKYGIDDSDIHTAEYVRQQIYGKYMQLIDGSYDGQQKNKDILAQNGYDWKEFEYYAKWQEDRERQLELQKSYALVAEQYPVMSKVLALTGAPIGMINEYLSDSAHTVFTAGAGEYSAKRLANIYDNNANTFVNVTNSVISQKVEKAVLDATGSQEWANLARVAESGVSSALQSAMTTAACTAMFGRTAGTIVSLGIMGHQAAASQFVESIRNGSPAANALVSSVAAGAAEAIFEKISLDRLLNANFVLDYTSLKGYVKSLLLTSKNVVVQGLVESSEELFTTLANGITDGIINGDHSAYNTAVDRYMRAGLSEDDAKKQAGAEYAQEILSSVIGGFFGGLAASGVQTTTQNTFGAYATVKNVISQNKLNKAIANAYDGDANALINEILDIDPNNEFALKMKARVDGGKKVSNAQIKELVLQSEEAILNQDKVLIKSAAKERLKELGETDRLDEISSAIAKRSAGEDMSATEAVALRDSKYADQVESELKSGAEWALKIGTERINAEEYSRIVNEAQIDQPAEEATEPTVKDSLQVEGETVQPDNANTQAPVNVLADNVVDIDEDQPEKSSITLEGAAKAYGKQAGAYVATYNLSSGQDVAKFDDAYRKAYEWGQSDAVPLDVAMSSSLTEYLTEAQREAAYMAGADAKNELTTKRTNAVSQRKNGKTGRRKGTVQGRDVSIADLKKTFNDKQGKAYKILSQIAEVTGIDIVLYRSEANEAGEFTEDQGQFKWGDDKIYIDINAGLETIKDVDDLAKYTMLRTFGHEFIHFLEKHNPAEYNELRKAVFDTLRERGKDVDTLILEKQKLGGKNKDGSYKLSYEAASREVVAEAMADVLPDANFVEALAKKHKNLFETLLEKLKEFLEDIRNYFASINPTMDEGAKALKDEVDGAVRYMGSLVTLFDKVAENAVENYQASVAVDEATTVSETKTETKAETKAEAKAETKAEDDGSEFTITDNAEYGSLEIKFDGKPSETVRDVLKANKFRWHKQKKVWYGKADRADIVKALRAAYEAEQQAEAPKTESVVEETTIKNAEIVPETTEAAPKPVAEVVAEVKSADNIEEEKENGENVDNQRSVPQSIGNGQGNAQLLDEVETGAVHGDGIGRDAVADTGERGRQTGRDDNRTDAERTGGRSSEGNSQSRDLRRDNGLTAEEAEQKAEQLHEQVVEQIAQQSTETPKGRNFVIGDSLDLPNGEKARYKANIEAIKLVKKLEAEGRHATEAEQAILSKYVGWGGLANAFDERKSEWANEYTELKELLSDEEYKLARGSTLNAHYTDISVIKAMYDGLAQLGFSGGRLLEPSSGVGNFVGAMPTEMSSKVKSWTMVELDSITGLIAKHLYPNADVRIQGFEKANIPDNYMDVAISNVPFGNYPITDKAYPKKVTSAIHNYFFAKSLDKVRPGGIVMFITSSYTMNSKDSTVRRYIMQRADLLGAIRLPDTAFKGNAGTEVVTDILILKKRAANTDYAGVDFLEAPYQYIESYRGANINNYFIEHPEMVLGKATMSGSMYRGDSLTYKAFTDKGSLADQIREAFKSIEGKMDYPAQLSPEKTNFAVERASKKTKEGGYVAKNGKIYKNDNGNLVEQSISDKTAERIAGMLEIRDAARELQNGLQQGLNDTEIRKARQKLNKAYDAFVKKHGYINSKANKSAIKGDPDQFSILALENWDSENKVATKADIFSKDTIAANRTVTSAKDVAEGLIVSINQTGAVDVALIAKLTGQNEDVVMRELIDSRLAFKNRNGELEAAETYLSGNVRAKLRDAEALVPLDEDYAKNVEALKSVMPDDVGYQDIFVNPGTPWIPNSVYSDFAAHMLGTRNTDWSKAVDVVRNPETGNFTVELQNKYLKSNAANTQKWGTSRRTFLDLFDAMLNSRSVVVKYKTDDGATVIDKDATAAANEKIENITKEFQEWLWKDEARRTELETLYNEVFNSIVTPKYNGDNLTVNGANAMKPLRPHQRNAVQRVISSGGNTLLAHKVGAGKTYEMAAAAMKLKQLGLVNKPLFAVPKPLVAQWGTEFMDFFPTARLLVSDETDFTTANRKTFMNRIANGNYDAVIVSYEQFEKLPMSDEFTVSLYEDEMNTIIRAIEEAKAEKGGKALSVKDLEKKRKSLQAKIDKLTSKPKDEGNINFEELGVDGLFVDEAHSFKNLFYTTSMTNVSGLSNKEGAARSFDLFSKVRYLQQLNGGRGIVFATATPVMNSMSEMYIMQKYLQPDLLEQLGLTTFDAWAKQFGEVVNGIEIKPSGQGYRVKQSFSRFKNMSELQLLFRNFADVLTDIPGLKIPKMKGGKVNVVVCEPGQFQQDFMKELEKRADNIKNVDPTEDNMLKITSDGRKISYTQRMIAPSLPYEEGCKIYRCADNVAQEYNDSKGIKGTQLIFCDMATPKGKSKTADAETVDAEMDMESAQLYDDLKSRLVENGIPAKEIAFIHEADTDQKKKKLFADVNEGKIRVLIGSTGKMGVGMNAQKRVVAIHHLDAPWRPGDVEQRNGRAFRQGNINDEVSCYTYVTEGSFDARLWDILERKQNFINQVMNGENVGRETEDTGEVTLSAAEVKALASGSPLIMEQVQLDTDIKKLESLRRAYTSGVRAAKERLEIDKGTIATLEKRIAAGKADMAATLDTYSEGKFSITVGKKKFTEKKDAGMALMAEATAKATDNGYITIGSFAGFDLRVVKTHEGIKGLLSGRQGYSFKTYPGNTTFMINHLIATVEGISESVKAWESGLVETRKDMAEQEKLIAEPFAKQAELDQKRARYNEVMEILNPKEEQALDSADEDIVQSQKRNLEVNGHAAGTDEHFEDVKEVGRVSGIRNNDNVAFDTGTSREDVDVDAGDRLSANGRGIVREDMVSRQIRAYVKQADRFGAKSPSPIFYSKMARVIEGEKQEKFGASAVVPMLRNRGVKAEEIKWSGIETFLDGKKSVTKAELQEFVAGSQLQIEETVKDKAKSDNVKVIKMTNKKLGVYVDGELMETFEWIKDEDGAALIPVGANISPYNVHVDKQGLLDHYKSIYGNAFKWDEYKLNGGKNYREIVLKMQNSTYGNSAMMGHWGEAAGGVLVHARIQDFNVKNGKMLFIEEIQSDWHNVGKSQGYESDRKRYLNDQKYREKLHKDAQDYGRQKAELEYDINNATGLTREQRRDLMDRRDKLDVLMRKIANITSGKNLAPDAPFSDNYYEYALKRLLRMAAEEGYDFIGWTTSNIQSSRWGKQFAEGYRIEYDQDIPKFLNKYGKKWGASVGKTTLRNGNEVWSMPITDAMKESVLYEGQEQYQPRTKTLSDHEVLEMAADEVLINDFTDAEKDAFDIFKKRLARLRDLQEQRAEQGSIYKEQQFGAKPNREKAAKTLNRMQLLDDQIKQANDDLFTIEEKAVLRSVLKKARRVVEQEERAKGEEKLKRWRDRRNNATAIKKYRERIKTDVDTLTNWILHPNNKDITQHVPDVLKNSVIPFLSSIDFTSKQQLRGGEATKADQEFVKQLKSMKAALKQNIDTYGLYSGYTDLPEDFMDSLQTFIETVDELTKNNSGEFIINKMTAEELQTLSKVVRTLKKYITQFNRFHYNSMYQYVYQAGDNSIQFMGELDDAGSMTGGVSNFIFWQQIRPAYAFERFGQGGKAIYDGFRRAHATLAFNTKVIEQFANETYTAKEVKAWEDEIKQIELDGDIVKVPVAMLMSFYELSKQPDSLVHILGEGVRVATYTRKGKKISDKGHTLTQGDVETMIATLTDRQKEVADALQKFMAETGGKWGNHVSMKRWGEELFGNPKYFPINSDGRHLQATADENPSAASLYALLNMSFTKERKEGANNRIILYSIFDVFANHMASMAQYNAFALPMLDALKWFNYQQKSMPDENGKREVLASVRDQMARAFGTPDETKPGSGKKGYAENFVMNILKAYNGTEAQGSPNDTFMLKWLHRYNVAQVSANLRVLIQQPTAIMRAGLLIDYRSIIKGMKLNPKAIKNNIEEMHKYSGIAVWKSLGFYDINISRGLTEIIKHDTGFVDKLNEIGMKGAETADLLTWAAIWSASKEEVIKKKGLKPTDNGFFEAVTELFEEVIYKTQVVDSVLTKNEYMRDKGFVAKWSSSFMSEPVTTASMVINAVDKYNMDLKRGMTRQQAFKRNGRFIGRVLYVYAASQIFTAAVQAIGDAWRDDDEYETFLEKWLEAFGGNLVDEILPFNKLPIINYFYEAIKELLAAGGLDIYGQLSNLPMADIVEKLSKGVEIILNEINDKEDNYGWYAGVYKLLQAVSGATGLPLAAATREVVDAWNNIIGPMAPSLKVKTYDPGDKNEIKYAYQDGYLTAEEATDLLIEKGLVDSENEAYWLIEGWEAGEDYSRYDTILDAVRNGGDVKAAMAELTGHGYTEDQVIAKVKSEIGDWYKEGKVSKQQATEMLTKYCDMDSKEITALVNKWSSKVVTGIDYDDIKDEYLAGNITAQRAIEMRVRYGGETTEKASEIVNKWRAEKETGINYDNLKEVFMDGEITEANARAMIVEYGGKTEEQALSTVRYWAFKRDYPDVYADDAWIDEYYEEIESSGMGIDVFVDYRNKAKGITGDDKKARRMAVINSMPITSAQKDALYYAEGWAASKIYEAPWH